MGTNAILQPVIALIFWTMLVWLWMYITRLPAISRAKLGPDKMVGLTGKDLDDILPPKVQWKAHNYNHLLDEPTLFYAVALSLALLGAGDGFNATLAWAYVVLRVIHSLVQITVNYVPARFPLFALSSIVLVWLTINAALVAF